VTVQITSTREQILLHLYLCRQGALRFAPQNEKIKSSNIFAGDPQTLRPHSLTQRRPGRL